MTQYNTLNVTLSNSQLNKLKFTIRNGTGGTLNLLSNIIVHFNDKNNFLHKLLLTNTQISRLHKAFANNSSANINLSKIQIHKIGQSGRVLDILLRPLLKTRLLLIGNVLKPLVKSVLKSLELTAVAPATDAAIYQNIFGS